VWIDITAPAHVLVFRPLIRILRERGADVEITARSYAQTLELLELHGVEAEVFGQHGGRSRVAKARALTGRLGDLRRWATVRRFDKALAHGSHELTITARRLGIPSATTFDYEFAWLQHQLGLRAATHVVVPDAIPPERLERYAVRPPKLRQYEGLKEEYYLADFEPDESVLGELGLTREPPLVTVRTPPEVSLYHRFENPLFRAILERLQASDAQAVVLPRTRGQREELARAGGFVVPERAVDAQSLIALSDLVVSAGGTMNREAVALGTPVYTTFEGRLGAVDEALLREGRLRRLEDPAEIELERRELGGGLRTRRDPRELIKMFLSAAA